MTSFLLSNNDSGVRMDIDGPRSRYSNRPGSYHHGLLSSYSPEPRSCRVLEKLFDVAVRAILPTKAAGGMCRRNV